jgi:hypothetical protein
VRGEGEGEAEGEGEVAARADPAVTGRAGVAIKRFGSRQMAGHSQCGGALGITVNAGVHSGTRFVLRMGQRIIRGQIERDVSGPFSVASDRARVRGGVALKSTSDLAGNDDEEAWSQFRGKSSHLSNGRKLFLATAGRQTLCSSRCRSRLTIYAHDFHPRRSPSLYAWDANPAYGAVGGRETLQNT